MDLASGKRSLWKTMEPADAAGIDRRNLLEIQDNLRLAMSEQLVHGGVKAIQRGAHAQTAVERDNLDGIHGARVDVQRPNPLAAETVTNRPH